MNSSKYPDLGATARDFMARGFAACPLRLNEGGIAKEPASESYPRLKPKDNLAHPWERTAGIGIVLGRPSGGLAVIDVDDRGLADFLRRKLLATDSPPMMVETARGRLHIYCQESSPSAPLDLDVSYQGRRCLVQLLATACVAAAPPTSRYRWLTDGEPLFGQVDTVWRSLSLQYGLPYLKARPFSSLRAERSKGPSVAQIREAST